MVIARAGWCYGCPFKTERGVTRGYPVYPTTFKIVVYAGVRAMLLEVCGTQEAQNGLGWAAGGQGIVFYSGNDQILGRNSIWVC